MTIKPPHDYEFEERAAILEYDGGLYRIKAEVQAKREIEARKNADIKNRESKPEK